jgi:hypothetical protein
MFWPVTQKEITIVLRILISPVLVGIGLWTGAAVLAENRIDTIRPDAPILAAYGSHKVGVQQITLTNPNQIDILAIDPGTAKPDVWPMYDRNLEVEVWYPARDDSLAIPSSRPIYAMGKPRSICMARRCVMRRPMVRAIRWF